MNSRYARPAPQGARMPQGAQQMQPLQWPTMNVPPPPQIAPDNSGQTIMNGMGLLGSAAIKRFGGDEPETPTVAMPAPAPVVTEPAIPIAPPPAYGVAPESAMKKKQPTLLEMVMGGSGMYGT